MKKKTVKRNIVDWCETCGSHYGLTASHLLKMNSIKNRKNYDYNNVSNYFTQCLTCHMEYEKLNKDQRYWYMVNRGKSEYANRIKRLIDGTH